jgi:potassium-transporting ATPase KdpC subunit
MIKQLCSAFILFILLTAVTGIAYPLLITGIGQAVFSHQAKGSLILQDGRVLGSELIGQPFADPKYFWGRPSATAPFTYNAAASSGSNFGPLNPVLLDAVKARVEALRQADPSQQGSILIDLMTASGSGLDPHISPAAAEYQISRVAKARKLDPKMVRELVVKYTEGRQLGFLGEPRVNVLKLNLALDGRAVQ